MRFPLRAEEFEIGLVLDCSESMTIRDCPPGDSITRFDYALKAVELLIKFPNVSLLTSRGSRGKFTDHLNAKKLERILDEIDVGGMTETANSMKFMIDRFYAKRAVGSVSPTLILLLSDGAPKDISLMDRALESSIQRQDKEDVFSIAALRIGRDREARVYFEGLCSRNENITVFPVGSDTDIELMAKACVQCFASSGSLSQIQWLLGQLQKKQSEITA
jgi:hypothetical protein